MCYPLVQLFRHSCGHDKPGGRITVDCFSPNCRYSSTHPQSGCTNCVRTCRQWMLPPQTTLAGSKDNICWNCAHGMPP
ncbi:hypothetical protein C8R45DRAFT_1044373 [Mycena sanguinolenta]|nr:hypothetical protein C8R45DRAFT_1044373 [Mycena sanguinolenta]